MITEQQATLCYLLKDDEVLLIRKKRGIGAGKINGPGGKVDPGETPLEAAVRETREEVGVTPLNLDLAIPLWFSIKDLPYKEMWADDQHWLPLLLAGKRFRGSVNVEGEEALDQQIEVLEEEV